MYILEEYKPVLLLDLNGVLVRREYLDERKVETVRPGVGLLLMLTSRYRLGIFSSATEKNLHRSMRLVFETAMKERKRLTLDHPDGLIYTGTRAAVDAAPGYSNSYSKSLNNPVVSRAFRPCGGGAWCPRGFFVVPREVSDVFSAGVFHRGHCRPDPNPSNSWDIVKPLFGLGFPMDRVLMFDDDPSKIVSGEEENAVCMVPWYECEDAGVSQVRTATEALLELPHLDLNGDGADLRKESAALTATILAASSKSKSRVDRSAKVSSATV